MPRGEAQGARSTLHGGAATSCACGAWRSLAHTFNVFEFTSRRVFATPQRLLHRNALLFCPFYRKYENLFKPLPMMRSFKVAPAPARARSYAVADAERHVAEAEELWRRSSEGSSSGGGGGKVGSARPLPRAPEDHLTLAKSAKTIMQRTTVTRQARGRSHTPKRLCTHVYSSRCQSARPYLARPCRVPQAKSVLLDLFSRRSSEDRSHGRERHGSSERRHGSERDHGSEQLSTIPTPLRLLPTRERFSRGLVVQTGGFRQK